jgi:hypothetical protein
MMDWRLPKDVNVRSSIRQSASSAYMGARAVPGVELGVALMPQAPIGQRHQRRDVEVHTNLRAWLASHSHITVSLAIT